MDHSEEDNHHLDAKDRAGDQKREVNPLITEKVSKQVGSEEPKTYMQKSNVP